MLFFGRVYFSQQDPKHTTQNWGDQNMSWPVTFGPIHPNNIAWNRYRLPWEPATFSFRGYNPYIGGSKPSFFMVLGSEGSLLFCLDMSYRQKGSALRLYVGWTFYSLFDQSPVTRSRNPKSEAICHIHPYTMFSHIFYLSPKGHSIIDLLRTWHTEIAELQLWYPENLGLPIIIFVVYPDFIWTKNM